MVAIALLLCTTRTSMHGFFFLFEILPFSEEVDGKICVSVCVCVLLNSGNSFTMLQSADSDALETLGMAQEEVNHSTFARHKACHPCHFLDWQPWPIVRACLPVFLDLCTEQYFHFFISNSPSARSRLGGKLTRDQPLGRGAHSTCGSHKPAPEKLSDQHKKKHGFCGAMCPHMRDFPGRYLTGLDQHTQVAAADCL